MAKFPAEFLTQPIAHRGLHNPAVDIVENSHRAFRAAIKSGYGIELDLQLSADGEAMVFHDYDLRRLTGEKGPIQMQHSDALQKLRLLGGAETIPTLADVLNLVDGKAPLLIELKDQDGALGPNVGKLEQRTAELLASYNGPAAVMSFNPYSVQALAEFAPNVPRGLTTGDPTQKEWQMLPRKRTKELFKILEYDNVGCCFISHSWRSLGSEPVLNLKKRGVPVLCWTVKTPEEEIEARLIADNITFEGYMPEMHYPMIA